MRQYPASRSLVLRARIILMAAGGIGVRGMAVKLDLGRVTLQPWGRRWRARAGEPLVGRLRDALRPGTPPTFKPEQICKISALARESPSGSGRPFTHRIQRTLHDASVGGGLVKRTRGRSLGGFLLEVKVNCHRIRGWINTLADTDSPAKWHDVCETLRPVPAREAVGVEFRSVDEITGARASERAAPTPPKAPGSPERSEFDYIRHGTITLIADCDMATGATGFRLGSTRTEGDCPQYPASLLTTRSPQNCRHLVMVSLNLHRFRAVLHLMAKPRGFVGNLGDKGQCGILNRMVAREQFLRGPTQRIVSYFTPNHASWINRIQVGFSIVARKVIRRGNFTSLDDLPAKIADFDNLSRLSIFAGCTIASPGPHEQPNGFWISAAVHAGRGDGWFSGQPLCQTSLRV